MISGRKWNSHASGLLSLDLSLVLLQPEDGADALKMQKWGQSPLYLWIINFKLFFLCLFFVCFNRI